MGVRSGGNSHVRVVLDTPFLKCISGKMHPGKDQAASLLTGGGVR